MLSRYHIKNVCPIVSLIRCNLAKSPCTGIRVSNGFSSQLLYSRLYSSSANPVTNKYRNQIIGGGIAFLTGTLVFYLTRQGKKQDQKTIDKSEDENFDVEYIDEHLNDNLALLEQFGPVPYLLIGGGTASFAAFRAIKTKDPKAKVLILGDEPFHPYMRPPLSKEMWFSEKPNVAKTLKFKQWDGKERSIFFEEEAFYSSVKDMLEGENGGVSLIRGLKVVKIDPTEQIVYLSNGKSLQYEKCLLAPGGKPKNLPIFEADELKKHVTLFRGIRDFQKLDKISNKVKSVAIVGGGFLGSELACALGKRSKSSKLDVVQVFPEAGNMGKVLPQYLSEWAMKKVENEGVKVVPSATIKSLSKIGNRVQMALEDGQTLDVDHVVVAVGLDPNTELAKSSGLEVDGKQGGFLVNAELEARRNLWIAGDAACFYDIKLGRRRVEHHDHAVVSGRLAGENMTGDSKPYWHQSMFWSDLGPEIGYEAIGIVDSTLETVGIFAKASAADSPKAVVEATGESLRSETETQAENQEMQFEVSVPRPPQAEDNFGKGIVFYLRDKAIVGILLWNVFSKMPIARKVLNESKPGDDLTEVAKVFSLKAKD